MDFELAKHTHLLVVAGSRAYGIHKPESDLDLKGVAIPPIHFYTGENMSFLEFSDKNPCRCGFDGTGTHFCHAGREINDRCTREANPKFISTMSALAGMQMKTGAIIACYCDECFLEAFPSSK